MENEVPVSVQEQQFGQVRISGEVVAIIAGLALNDIAGIYQADRRKNRKNLSKDIVIRLDGSKASCTIELVLVSGYKIPALAAEIQEKVKSTIENMTGLEVTAVDLNIRDIRSEKAEEDKKPEE